MGDATSAVGETSQGTHMAQAGEGEEPGKVAWDFPIGSGEEVPAHGLMIQAYCSGGAASPTPPGHGPLSVFGRFWGLPQPWWGCGAWLRSWWWRSCKGQLWRSLGLRWLTWGYSPGFPVTTEKLIHIGRHGSGAYVCLRHSDRKRLQFEAWTLSMKHLNSLHTQL